MPTPPSRSSPTPESLLAEYLARRAAGSAPDFETFCSAHPAHTRALRELIGQYERLQAALRAVGLSGVGSDAGAAPSLAERLRQKFGAGVDPEISLDGAPGAGPSAAEDASCGSMATDDFIRRLREHSLDSSRYQLEGELARGGMGAILKIWDEDLRRHLAMKVMLGGGEAPAAGGVHPVEPRQLARFLEEAQITGQLDHPGIVPVHELGLDGDGRVYFTMKLVKGRDLTAVFELVFAGAEGWNETRALSVMLRACEALAYAHKKGVIHRDLKPGNVMVGHFGEVYVMDWGLARVLGREDRHDLRIAPDLATARSWVQSGRHEERELFPDSPIVTMDGDVVGTPSYMPPEQARGELAKLGPRSDVYAIGAMLYHLLTRQVPYVPRGTQISHITVLELLMNGPPAPITTLRKDVPAELVAIVEKAMAREPAQRYADTLALAEDLRAYLEHRVVGAYETGAWAEARKWVKRNKPLAASLAAAVSLLVAGLTVSLVFKARADENALLATRRAQETAEQARIAEGNAERAREQERLAKAEEQRAKEQEAEAKRQEGLATQKTRDVLSLSAIQDLQDLVDEADRLWPPHPENLAAYDAWLAKAHVLIAGRPGDAARGVSPKPSLADHEAKLAELEARALPQTDEESARERASHPRAAELAAKRAKAQWMARMLGKEPWPSEAEIEAALAKDAALPSDANGLAALAWPLVEPEPEKEVFGDEVKALLLARRALAAAKQHERSMLRRTLAWALFKNGRFDEALAEVRTALAEAPETEKPACEGSVKKLEGAVDRWRDPDGKLRVARTEERAKLDAGVSELVAEMNRRREWTFANGEDRWWHVQLNKLVRDLRAFTDETTGGLYSSGVSAAHSWGILKRAEFARTIEERSVSGAEARTRWSEALAAIARSEPYRTARWTGGPLAPQIGLLPIGADPASGLWEFAHLMSGDEPERGADGVVKRDAQGRLLLKPETCIVLVLIPGGKFTMGAQKDDPTAPSYDPDVRDSEMAHEVTLSAYFVSKYEVTQGQWERLSGRNPSQYGPQRLATNWNREGKDWTALHPVELVNWTRCLETMERAGLTLPSEAQWEHAARAGTSCVFWTGDDGATLAGAANLADAYGKNHGGESWSVWESDIDDGNTVHAEVGSYRANAFGLFDVHGNVWEWVLDSYDSGFYRTGPKVDPVCPWNDASYRVYRGGGFEHAASFARSSKRVRSTPGIQAYDLGLRPARASSLSAPPPPRSGK